MNVKPARSGRWKRLLLGVVVLLIAIGAGRQLGIWWPLQQVHQELAADRLDAARWWLDWAARFGRNHPETWLYHSRWARKAGDLERAEQSLRVAEVAGLAADRVVRERMLLQAQAGDIRDASRLLPLLLQGSPDDAPEVCEAFAIGFCRTHYSMETAISLLNAWAEDYPEDPRPHLYLAELSLEVMDVDNGARELRRALDIDPEHPRAALRLGELMLQQQSPEEARRLFEIAEQSSAVRSRALVGQAGCLRTVGRLAAAEAVLAIALQESPESAGGNIEMARLEVARGEFEAATKRLRAVLEREPFQHAARNVLAAALQSLGEAEAARAELATASEANAALVRARHLARDLALEPENVELRWEVVQIYRRYGDPRLAREWLQSVLLLDPDHAGAKAALEELNTSGPPRSE